MSSARSRCAVTPVLLTYNEEPNIRRTLVSLSWAADVVVLDSHSTDRTAQIAGEFPNVRWFRRPFDAHGPQWRYALEETGIKSEYVLALDADMATPAPLIDELESRFLAGAYAGATIPFEYWLMGRPLMGSILRPQLRLFRHHDVRVGQTGHTQHFAVDGPVYRFRSPLRHDDRKSLDRWVHSQLGYSAREMESIAARDKGGLKDRLRRAGVMPIVVGSLAYLRTGGPLGGKPALRYAWERVTFECLLALRMFERDVPRDAAGGE